jgi:5-methylcytosine-specific restriction protein A
MKARLSTIPPKVKTIDTRRGSGAAVERIRGYALQKIRLRILLRDGYACRVCGRASADGLEIDHVVPLHLGGKETDQNRQALCPECHAAKSAIEERGRGGKS